MIEHPNKSETQADFMAKKPPLWVPDHLSINCHKCDFEFTFFLRIHHCRNCGKSFCNRCSNHFRILPEYGYDKNVRVCIDCYMDKIELEDSSDDDLPLDSARRMETFRGV